MGTVSALQPLKTETWWVKSRVFSGSASHSEAHRSHALSVRNRIVLCAVSVVFVARRHWVEKKGMLRCGSGGVRPNVEMSDDLDDDTKGGWEQGVGKVNTHP